MPTAIRARESRSGKRSDMPVNGNPLVATGAGLLGFVFDFDAVAPLTPELGLCFVTGGTFVY
jgi:hypothetical protein